MPPFRSVRLLVCLFVTAALIAGCGSSSSTPTTISLTPSTVAVSSGAQYQFMATVSPATTVVIWQVNGIAGGNSAVGTISSSGLYQAPATSNSLTVNVSVTDSTNISITASSRVSVTVAVPTISLTPASVAIGSNQTTSFTASVNPSGDSVIWQVNGIAGGNSTIGTVSLSGVYTSPATGQAQSVTVSAIVAANPSVMALSQVFVIPPSVVTTTNNPQVASYTMDLPASGTVSVQFGPTTAYGTSTWQVSSPAGGGPTTVLVAGMLGGTEYHMQAQVALANGLTYSDVDQAFTTGSIPAAQQPHITGVSTASGQTPQPGVELLSNLPFGGFVYDLQGNLLWGYPPANLDDSQSDSPGPIKLLPNGHMLILIGPGSAYSISGPVPVEGTIFEAREVDLGNNTIRSLTMANVQDQLAAFGYKDSQGNTPALLDIHHDITVNPNTGHWLVLANYQQTLTVTGYSSPQTVLGDIVMDVDPNNNFAVDWVWDEFSALDVNRIPWPAQWPDWTHTNGVTYSPTDHNVIISIRHQNWVLKVNYNDGAGNGDIVWHLGEGGDFTLENGIDPIDWFYAQHDPSFTTSNSAGQFGLTLMDNGDDRILGSSPCPVALTSGLCLYSRAPIFMIDESAMTATLSNGQVGPVYNFFGGNAEKLANGDEEADYCGAPFGSEIIETTTGNSPQTVWTMTTFGYEYRGMRIPSLYPGVQW